MFTETLPKEEALFDRCWWIYAVCREHLFTDHTRQIAAAIKPLMRSALQRHLLEVGCGPGFYSRRLAERFPSLNVTGIDTSERLLNRARQAAERARLGNCRFLKADAHSLIDFPGQVDAVVASRLFLILADRDLALDAMFRTLRPGGICFIAEPLSIARAAMPLCAMQCAALLGGAKVNLARSFRCEVLSGGQFHDFMATQPWRRMNLWHDRRYQYAVCEKSA